MTATTASPQDLRKGAQNLLLGCVGVTPGEQVLLADSGRQAVVPERAIVPLGAGPVWLRAFVERDTRSILLVMSGGLVLFAFVYYPASGRSVGAKKVPRIPVHSMPARFTQPTQSHQSSIYKT